MGLAGKTCSPVSEGMSARLVAIQKKKGMIDKVTGSGAVKKTIKEWVEERRVATEAKRKLKEAATPSGEGEAEKSVTGTSTRASKEAREDERKKMEARRRANRAAQKAQEVEDARIGEAAGSKQRRTSSAKLEESRKGAGAPRKPCGRSAPSGAPK